MVKIIYTYIMYKQPTGVKVKYNYNCKHNIDQLQYLMHKSIFEITHKENIKFNNKTKSQ